MTVVYKISLVASRPGNYITPKVDDHHQHTPNLTPYSYRTTTTFLVLVKEQVRFDETLVQLSKPCRLLVRVAREQLMNRTTGTEVDVAARCLRPRRRHRCP